jgi:hypothetical protein
LLRWLLWEIGESQDAGHTRAVAERVSVITCERKEPGP